LGLAESILTASLPDGVRTRLVAIDGLGGAGKSTLAAELADELDAVVVHTDDFASWENPLDWWPALLEQVLEPLAAGRSARFVPNTWGGPERPTVEIDAGGVVIVEGVTASREAFRPYLAFSIWVETPRETRLARGLARDGEPMREQWEAWMASEDRYVERERPDEHADAVVSGSGE
jgi:uridine kinase